MLETENELLRYFTAELKVLILFVSFLFTAAQLSFAKSNLVLFAMLLQDAGKAFAVGLQTCQYLLWVYRQQAVTCLESSGIGL